jgi:hypothetical protein
MPVKRRISKRRAEQPAIDRLLAAMPIEFSLAAHRELINGHAPPAYAERHRGPGGDFTGGAWLAAARTPSAAAVRADV